MTPSWHSPVPYLFGGLALILGLIAFALLVLACSYWKLSQNSHSVADSDRDLEAGSEEVKPPAFEEKYLVIMAGQEKPTFLATQSSSRTSSFGGSNSCRSGSTMTYAEDSGRSATRPTEEDEGDGQVQVNTMGSHEFAYHVS
ncbi:putative protein glutamine dumper [Helianthus anomalus]